MKQSQRQHDHLNLCPVEQLPDIEAPCSLTEPIRGFRKLAPGKQEIYVNKPYGFYFDANSFAELEEKYAYLQHYIMALKAQIAEYNEGVENWEQQQAKEEILKQKQWPWTP